MTELISRISLNYCHCKFIYLFSFSLLMQLSRYVDVQTNYAAFQGNTTNTGLIDPCFQRDVYYCRAVCASVMKPIKLWYFIVNSKAVLVCFIHKKHIQVILKRHNADKQQICLLILHEVKQLCHQ